MRFIETPFKGPYLIELKKNKDKRGFFARTWCRNEFKRRRLNTNIAQCSISYNKRRGTLRGMHYQVRPHQEAKLVTCIKGAIYDVIIDLRKGSPTYREWFSTELTSENNRMLYVPEGFAQGFQTLEDNTVVFYQISEFYHPESVKGIKWDDAAFHIKWPSRPQVISKKDRAYPKFKCRALSPTGRGSG